MSSTAAHPAPTGDGVWHLRLYVAGQSPKSLLAFANLRVLCDEHLAGRYDIEVVDLVEQPERAKSDDILDLHRLVFDQIEQRANAPHYGVRSAE